MSASTCKLSEVSKFSFATYEQSDLKKGTVQRIRGKKRYKGTNRSYKELLIKAHEAAGHRLDRDRKFVVTL